MARRYRAEDDREEEFEDERPEDELETQEEDHDAEDERPDEEAEDDDLDEEADDEDEEHEAQDEDETKSKKAVRSHLSERKRCAGLMRLEKTARKLGVKFDAAKAIANGLGLNMARTRVLTAAANADRAKSISPHARTAERSFGGISKAKARTMWSNAKKKGKR